jgi:hypothetical protein
MLAKIPNEPGKEPWAKLFGPNAPKYKQDVSNFAQSIASLVTPAKRAAAFPGVDQKNQEGDIPKK